MKEWKRWVGREKEREDIRRGEEKKFFLDLKEKEWGKGRKRSVGRGERVGEGWKMNKGGNIIIYYYLGLYSLLS